MSTCLQDIASGWIAVKSDVAEVEATRSTSDGSCHALCVVGGVGVGVCCRHTNYGGVENSWCFFCEVSKIHFDTSMVVLSHDETVKYHMAHVFSQDTVL